MAHTTRDRTKLLNRVKRIRGQIEAVSRAIEEDADCSKVLQLVAACRGAMNGLMVELLEGHVRFHIVDPDQRPDSARAQAVQELLDVLKTYLR